MKTDDTIGLLRDVSVEKARRLDLTDAIAGLTGISARAVRSRLARSHGRALLENAFADVWPSALAELGHLPAKVVVQNRTLIDEVARLIGRTPTSVLRLLSSAKADATTGDALTPIWRTAADLSLSDLAQTRVADARAMGAGPRLAELLDVRVREVVRGLARAHGAAFVSAALGGYWPKVDRVLVQKSQSQPDRQMDVLRAKSAAPRKAPKARTIHRVRQEFPTSCGVAVVAMFARVSHERAMSAIFARSGKRRVYYTNYPDVIRALDRLGVNHDARQTRFVSWEEIPSTSLVKVKGMASDGKGFLHWVVFQKRLDGSWDVVDPDAAHPETQRLRRAELRHLTGVSYLGVVPVPPP